MGFCVDFETSEKCCTQGGDGSLLEYPIMADLARVAYISAAIGRWTSSASYKQIDIRNGRYEDGLDSEASVPK